MTRNSNYNGNLFGDNCQEPLLPRRRVNFIERKCCERWRTGPRISFLPMHSAACKSHAVRAASYCVGPRTRTWTRASRRPARRWDRSYFCRHQSLVAGLKSSRRWTSGEEEAGRAQSRKGDSDFVRGHDTMPAVSAPFLESPRFSLAPCCDYYRKRVYVCRREVEVYMRVRCKGELF